MLDGSGRGRVGLGLWCSDLFFALPAGGTPVQMSSSHIYKGCVRDSVHLLILYRNYRMIRNSGFRLTSPVNLMFTDDPRPIQTVKITPIL